MAKSKYTAIERASALEFGSYLIYKRSRVAMLRGDFVSNDYFAQFYLPDYDVCRCLWRASYARSKRLRLRLSPMVEAGAWFVTLTFSDKVLSTTSPRTRRDYVRRYLKGICVDFVANKDFGADNAREHYHAVISSLYDPPSVLGLVHDSKGAHSTMLGWVYGFSNWESIGSSKEDNKHLIRVSRYISKLGNHALKETASREIMIFSRKVKNG